MKKDFTAETFRRWGYLQAQLDPFNRIPPFPHAELDELSGPEAKKWREIYCGSVGAEFMHMPFPERCRWVSEALETTQQTLDNRFLLERTMSAELFERFLHTRYVGMKRFSLEGLCSLVPLLDQIIHTAADEGVEIVMLAMGHRGRLNVMLHTAKTPASNIFAGFEDVDPKSVLGSGDVKYHKGATGIYKTTSGKELQVRLASNPSHLEAINPVLMGRARARQERLEDTAHKKVLAILIHGDAAFAGQGITAEALNLADMRGFKIGGTVHIIANNLIGFTAEPKSLHSSRYATDIAKRLPVPIFHVDAESLTDVARVGQIATRYRGVFQSDVVIDLIGHRRHGHSEVDDPTITSPLLYQQIHDHPPLFIGYGKKLGLDAEELKKLEEQTIDGFKAEQEQGQAITKQPSFFSLPDYWVGYVGGAYSKDYDVLTGVQHARLVEIAKVISSTPAEFTTHTKLKKLIEQRLEMAEGKRAVDWGTAEALAFGSLLWDGIPVRLTGQDSRRGTFNHRHAALYDTKTGAEYLPLRNLHPNQARFAVYDSILSEAAVLGFEYGYARDYPEALVLWEAQFGDFVNGAQIITDQFIAAGEDKWGLLAGVVLLLPHGFEGQGPEHSSARIERFLQLCAEENMQVCQPSTAGQYFHLLRRQALRKWRKPLVIFTPKSMLRAAPACSPVEYLVSGAFQNAVADSTEYESAERILFCTGKIVHELRTERATRQDTNTSIIPIEQLYPFPEDEISEILSRYSNASTLIWVQEEPDNMGALSFVRPRLEQLADGRHVSTVRRSASASPATGSPKAHAMEQQALIKLAFAKYS